MQMSEWNTNGQVADLPLVVTKGTGPSLLRRNWLAALKLDWEQIFGVNSVHTLEEVLKEFKKCFRMSWEC